MGFSDLIQQEQTAMIRTLQQLIAIPSVKADSAGEDAPFGPEIARALKYVLAWGDQHGFVTQNRLGYAGHLEYGDEAGYTTRSQRLAVRHPGTVSGGDLWPGCDR